MSRTAVGGILSPAAGLKWPQTKTKTKLTNARIPGDARPLGLSDGERFAVVTWIASNPAGATNSPRAGIITAVRCTSQTTSMSISLSQGEFASLFGLSKRALEHWEHGRRVPSARARAFLTAIAREPDAVRRALLG